jgi:hypothetical protein
MHKSRKLQNDCRRSDNLYLLSALITALAPESDLKQATPGGNAAARDTNRSGRQP